MNTRNKTTVILGALFAGLLTASIANAIICEAQLPRTICGSGQVTVQFDPKTGIYQANIGDVRCYFADFDFRGRAVRIAKSFPYFLENTFELYLEDGDPAQDSKVGLLIYDPELRVAQLQLVREVFRNYYGLIGNSYNLRCDSKNLEKNL